MALKNVIGVDHAVVMVLERTKDRYAAFGPDVDPVIGTKFDRVSGTASNVAGIMHWLEGMERVNVCLMGWPGSFFRMVGSDDALNPECPNCAYAPEWEASRSLA